MKESRHDQIKQIARQLYEERTAKGFTGTPEQDWYLAEMRWAQKQYWKKEFDLKDKEA